MSGGDFLAKPINLWNVYAHCKDNTVTPSEFLDIPTHTRRKYGFNVWWVCYNVDLAVNNIGRQIENRINELDDNGKPKYSLEYVLGVRKPKPKPRKNQNLRRFVTGKPTRRKED